MSEQVAQRFIEGLHRLEERRDLEALVAVFTETAEIGNIVAHEEYRGREGAREFWKKYRDAFGEVHSSFRNIITMSGRAALEWTTEGTNPEGARFEYKGVSILEIEGDAVSRFHAFFDSAALGQQLVPNASVHAKERSRD